MSQKETIFMASIGGLVTKEGNAVVGVLTTRTDNKEGPLYSSIMGYMRALLVPPGE
jgi:hypothetical protein